MKLVVRGYGDGKLVFEEKVECFKVEELTPIADSQLERLEPYEVSMLEVEFLDQPDPLKRFFRFGTDKSGMVRPREIFQIKRGSRPS